MMNTRTVRVALTISLLLNLWQYLRSPCGTADDLLSRRLLAEAEEAVNEKSRQLSEVSGSHHGTSEANHVDTSSHPDPSVEAAAASPDISEDDSGHEPHKHHDHHEHHEEHVHQQTAMVFLFGTFIVGIAVLHLTTIFPKVQDTVLWFVLGMAGAFLMEAICVRYDLGLIATSYNMWMHINPHLLLFTLLPPLIAGDAMTIDTTVASRVGYQCIYLAGPGVLVQALIVAVFLQWLMQWDFWLSLTTGSILCATDPVAVVALLKELGASPVLTVQIQGESLLNDGTAIVLFLVAYRSLQGENFGFDQYLSFLIRTAMMAWALGMFSGYFFFSWIRLANNRFAHASGMIQATLSLCACYVAFVLAEGVFGISGVLATVASSAVLSVHMWHHIVNRESMEVVWHTVETLGNILIFFLAGSLTGRVMLHTTIGDFGRLLALYCFLLVLRAAFIFASIPLLKLLSTDRQPVTIADAAVMTWGGLRGAVGLALAIQVFEERAPHIVTGELQVSKQQAGRVFFFVAGIALLTTTINATTCPMLVNWLRITAVPTAKQRLLKMLAHRLFDFASEQKVPREVVNHLKETHDEIEHEIDEAGTGPAQLRQGTSYRRMTERIQGSQSEVKDNNPTVAKKLLDARVGFLSLPQTERKHVPIDDQGLPQTEELEAALKTQEVDVDMAKVVNRTFLSLVTKGYWNRVEDGTLRGGSAEANLLFRSVQLSQSPMMPDLIDYEIIEKEINKETDDHGPKALSWWKLFPTHEEFRHFKCGRAHHELVHSDAFNLTLSIVILVNAIYLVIDTMYRTEENAGHVLWWIIDVAFQLIFTVECMMKLMDMSWHYFTCPSNVFDFFLVILGFVGFALASVLTKRDATKATGEARSIRFVRLFRILRFLRVVRLYHAFKSGRGHVSQELADHVKHMTILDGYICAHIHAQRALVDFFGRSGRIDPEEQPELARCMCQSQVSVYKAAAAQINERMTLDLNIRNRFDTELQEKAFTEHLENFILKAMDGGALSAREAESLLHPLQHQLKHVLQRLDSLNEGIINRDESPSDKDET